MKLKLAICTIVLGACVAFAQTSPASPTASTGSQSSSQNQSAAQSSSTGMTQQQADMAAKNTFFEGCLGGNSGNYTLTDAQGVQHSLEGKDSKLSQHVGQQVRIIGHAEGTSAAASSGWEHQAGPTTSNGATTGSIPSATNKNADVNSTTGNTGNPTQSGVIGGDSSQASGQANPGQKIQVERVKELSTSCSTGSQSGTSPQNPQ